MRQCQDVDQSDSATFMKNPDSLRALGSALRRHPFPRFERIQMLQLSEVKLHLRIDHSEEDLLLSDMIDTAADAVASHLNLATPLVWPPSLPGPVRSAMLLLVGDLYENRAMQSDRPLHMNQTYERLLAPYRQYYQ